MFVFFDTEDGKGIFRIDEISHIKSGIWLDGRKMSILIMKNGTSTNIRHTPEEAWEKINEVDQKNT